jgi:tRNA G18 (ribose-2'-O)-methylase SpoU
MPSRAIDIADADDPRVAAYTSIRERDLVGREGLFVAEGKVVLDVLFSAARFEPVSALILENRLEGMQATLAKAPSEMPVYVAPQAVLDRIAGFHLHRGILALGRRRPAPTLPGLLATLPANALVVGLIGISNHDNMGSIFRNAAAFEADAVVLDPSCCDPLYRKAIRVSVGAVLKVPFVEAESEAAMLSAFAGAEMRCLALSPGGAVEIAHVAKGGSTALLLGTEGQGLPASVLDRTTTVRIGMSGSFDSLNVAAASAIALHRLWRGG